MDVNLEQLQALYQVLDTSWGNAVSKNYSVKFKLVNDGIEAVYATVLNCGNERELVAIRKSAEDEAERVISAVVTKAKEECKKNGVSTNLVKNSKFQPTSSVEMLCPAVYNPKRSVIFRYVKRYTL